MVSQKAWDAFPSPFCSVDDCILQIGCTCQIWLSSHLLHLLCSVCGKCAARQFLCLAVSTLRKALESVREPRNCIIIETCLLTTYFKILHELFRQNWCSITSAGPELGNYFFLRRADAVCQIGCKGLGGGCCSCSSSAWTSSSDSVWGTVE